MNLAQFALKRSRLIFFGALTVLFAGAAAYLDFPAQEEPTLPVRAAGVAAYLPWTADTAGRAAPRPPH